MIVSCFNRIVRFHSKKCCEMFPKAGVLFVKQYSPDSSLEIKFKYEEPRLDFSHEFNFCRDPKETVKFACDRISCKIVSKMSKKLRKHNKSQSSPLTEDDIKPDVVFTTNGKAVAVEVPSKTVLVDCSERSRINIGSFSYEICVNQPTVKQLRLPNHITANYEVYPSQLELEFANSSDSIAVWHRGVPLNDARHVTSETVADSASVPECDWHQVGTGVMYRCSAEDANCYLRLHLTPGCGERRGPPLSAVSGPVQQRTLTAEQCPIAERHTHTPHPLPRTHLRVVSYNLLADFYADSDFTRTVLHPYCPPHALSADYRRQLLQHELAGYHADLLCLQEVDRSFFNRMLVPALGGRGLQGRLHCKCASVPEGLAVFWRADKLRLVSSDSVVLAEAIFGDEQRHLLADVAAACARTEQLRQRVANRKQLLQLCVLERCGDGDHGPVASATHSHITESTDGGSQHCSNLAAAGGGGGGDLLLVANTHLYFHPDADHIRAVQIGACMRLVEQRRDQLLVAHPGRHVSVLFCGDFNSCPQFSVYQLMVGGRLASDFVDFSCKSDEEVQGVQFCHRLSIASACGQPAYTNHVGSFSGCLDYIFYETDRLSVERVVPLPSDEVVTRHTALPSMLLPSDHLALVADLVWTNPPPPRHNVLPPV